MSMTLAEDQFRLLVASVKDYAIFLLDREGRVASWNAGAEVIKGYRAEEIIGRHISIFYTPEDAARDKPGELLRTAAAQGRVEDEGWRVRKDGRRFWADAIITALHDPTNEIIGFVKVTRDLTARRETEDRLRQSESSLAATLYSIGDAVLATDERGHITRINPVAERLTGWQEQEAVGRPIDEVFRIINEQTRVKAENPVDRVLKEGIIVGLANHTALISRDGVERPIADSGAPIRDLQGATRGAVLVFRDVTDERRAEEALRQSEERLRLMLASVRDYAIIMLDAEGRVMSWNPGAELILGFRPDEILGQSFARFFPAEDASRGAPALELRRATEAGRVEEECWRVRKDGSRFWANIIVTPIRESSEGRIVGFTKITRDLTERRKGEEERLRLAQAQEALRLRDEFLSIASHELKTPLTALLLQLHGAVERAVPIDEGLARKMDRAMKAAQRLADLVEALLDVSRIATGRVELRLESFDLVETTHEVIDRIRDAASKAGCALTVGAEGPIRGTWDRLRIEQILTNLLANAIKYAAGRPIHVLVGRQNGAALLQVRDQGPGLAENALPRIFDRFERASSTTYGGMGLGLYIARQIAEAHGGQLAASNAPGGGAQFALTLPVAD